MNADGLVFCVCASTYSNPVACFRFFLLQSCHDEEDDDGEEEVKSFEVRWIFLDLPFSTWKHCLIAHNDIYVSCFMAHRSLLCQGTACRKPGGSPGPTVC